MRKYILFLLLATTGCATYPTTKVGVPVKCPDMRIPAEILPDTPQAIANIRPGDIESLEKLVMKGRVIRDQRLSEDEAQIKACSPN